MKLFDWSFLFIYKEAETNRENKIPKKDGIT